MTECYDCLVLGGGPAGSTVAALTAEAGFSTLQVEREKMPRFHIGESLMPETYWTLKRLGVLERMKQSHFPKKYSVQFVSSTGRESQPFYFFQRYDHESAQTWQVLRSEFDQMLWENSAAKGADCRDQTRVVEVTFEGERASGVLLEGPDGGARRVTARVVVDATGLNSLVSKRLRLREAYPGLRNASVWTYYRGGRRGEGYDEGATIVLHTQSKDAWFWYIPLPDDIVSVGVVAENDYLLKRRGTPEEIFAQQLAACPAVEERLAAAERVSGFRVLRDFSYTSRRAAGPGWVLVGDAYAFLDPIYSSGVFLALKSGELAADCLIEGLRRDDLSGEQLGKWATEFDRGVDLIRRLVYAFYTKDFSFGRFMQSFPQHQGNLTDLLVGKVFHETAGEIFNDMEPWLASNGDGYPDPSPASSLEQPS